jgi:hypothetical protein
VTTEGSGREKLFVAVLTRYDGTSGVAQLTYTGFYVKQYRFWPKPGSVQQEALEALPETRQILVGIDGR